MPIAVHMAPDIHILYTMVYGPCLLSELFQVARAPEHDPDNRPRMKLIIDCRRGDLDIDTEGVQSGLSFIRDLEKTGFEMEPTAILTGNDLVAMFFDGFGFALNDTTEIRKVFSSLEEAIAWLGVSQHAQAICKIQNDLLAQLRAETFSFYQAGAPGR